MTRVINLKNKGKVGGPTSLIVLEGLHQLFQRIMALNADFIYPTKKKKSALDSEYKTRHSLMNLLLASGLYYVTFGKSANASFKISPESCMTKNQPETT